MRSLSPRPDGDNAGHVDTLPLERKFLEEFLKVCEGCRLIVLDEETKSEEKGVDRFFVRPFVVDHEYARLLLATEATPPPASRYCVNRLPSSLSAFSTVSFNVQIASSMLAIQGFTAGNFAG